MEEMDKLLQNMTKMKDDMSKMQDELKQYVLSFSSSDGKVSLKVHGDGVISGLKTNGASDSDIEKAVNDANAKVKDYIANKMDSITPAEFRDAQ